MSSADAIERKLPERADRGEPAAEAPKAAPPVPMTDRLELSAVAQQTAQEPEIDRAKVEAIKQALAEGKYVVDHQKAAEAFLNLEQMIKS
jgi:flagellar biosynthesis anti-sigma factor FlgM